MLHLYIYTHICNNNTKEKKAINLRRNGEGRREVRGKENESGWRKELKWGCDVITLY